MQHLLTPDIGRTKASSLPSILDVENNDEDCMKDLSEEVRTPTSTTSTGKYTGKLKNWKIPKFMRKLSEQRQEMEVDVFTAPPLVSSDDGYHQVIIIH